MKKFLSMVLAIVLLCLCSGLASAAYLENPRSGKFHYENCRTIKHRSNFNEVATRQQAVDDGYTPCGVCRP